jgi:phospholipid/cholesterol/gamma-HCH transport system substrate-binding protein
MSRVARLGAFVVATLAILAAGVFFIGSKSYLFSSTYRLKTQFDNVAGLAAGADVQVGGVHSGTVESIDLPHMPGEKVSVLPWSTLSSCTLRLIVISMLLSERL